MRRIVLWVLSTLSALVALLGYHTSTSSVMATGTPDNAISGSLQGQATTRSATGSASGSGSGSGSGSATSGSGSGSAGQSSTAASTVTGDSVGTPYGPVQVRVAVDGSTITDVTVLQYPDQDGHSVQINQYALPQLINETLDAQGSGISMVSGATYTSQGYLQSLQSALDQAGL
ncbi:FMN-binding protein [Nocardioides sp. P5_E3]